MVFELRVGLTVNTNVAAVGKIAHEADHRLAAVPQAVPRPAQDAREGIEALVAGGHFADDTFLREPPIPGHWERQRVVFPVFREPIEGDASLRFHLVP